MEPADAAFFDGMLPHAFDVLGEEEVEVLFVAGVVSGGGHAVSRRGVPGGSTLFVKGTAW